MNAMATTFPHFDEKLFPQLHPASGSLMTETTVLLAEDDEDLRSLMDCTLRSLGYGVVACADGDLALKAFKNCSKPVNVLLTDLQMPGMSGLELARKVTASQATLPVLLLTGSILTMDDVKELVDRGWAYMGKPCDIKVLGGTLHRLINRSMRANSL